ncbi:hypothetical protein K435DRAFT_791347 [Dendrothele bispora CBS 962.96]|uniref:Uncharacterized protein n=1 Tax=Dendrothele bispora (strain CBS 962.96) TaxID=1314807 RepID=A0A4S8MMA6_DENBC|nr:hypothetical protein K435DRAFT_791347 [Dendrothele bispora CBS 962.96]
MECGHRMAGHAVKNDSPPSSSTFPRALELSVGDIVGTFSSPMEAFSSAISSPADSSRYERSTICSRESGREKKQRPAVIRDIQSGMNNITVYELSLLASFSSTPFETLHDNTKDLVIPVASLGNEHPKSRHFIRTEPPWPKKIQYVVTRTITTSEVFEWWTDGRERYRINEQDLDILDQLDLEQTIKLETKLLNYPGGGVGWLKDINQAAKAARRRVPSGSASTRSLFRAFSVKSSASKISRLESINENQESKENDWTKVSYKRRPLREKINRPR